MKIFHCSLALILLNVAFASTSLAQLGDHKNEVIDNVHYHFGSYFKFEITPAAIDRADRQRSFFRDPDELQDGNAAIYYYRACLQWRSQPRDRRLLIDKNWDKWFQCSIDDFPKDEVADFLDTIPGVFKQLEIAFQRKECDWDHNFDNMDYAEFATYDLSEIHSLRVLFQLVQLQTRLAIAHGEFEAATNQIKNTIKFGQDVARIPAIVAGLTGEKIIQIGLQNVIVLSERAGSPNNSIALQSIKRPVVDYFSKIRTEHKLIKRGFKFLDSPESSNRSREQWKNVFADAMQQMDRIMQEMEPAGQVKGDDQAYRKSLETRAAILLSRLYPVAKRELIAAGWNNDKVEAMPVGQAVAIQTKRVLDEFESGLNGLRNLPSAEAVKTARARFEKLEAEGFLSTSARGDFPLSEFLHSWINVRFVVSGARTINRKLVMIQNVERLRDFAAQNNSLPTAEQCKALNLNPDPLTGEPFDYSSDGDSAVIQTVKRTNNSKQHVVTDIHMKIKLAK